VGVTEALMSQMDNTRDKSLCFVPTVAPKHVLILCLIGVLSRQIK